MFCAFCRRRAVTKAGVTFRNGVRRFEIYLREVGWTEGQKGGCNGNLNGCILGEAGTAVPVKGTSKDGDFLQLAGRRRPKQLSYNFNYEPFSDAMYGDHSYLLFG